MTDDFLSPPIERTSAPSGEGLADLLQERRNLRDWFHRIEETCARKDATTREATIRHAALAALRGVEAPSGVGLILPPDEPNLDDRNVSRAEVRGAVQRIEALLGERDESYTGLPKHLVRRVLDRLRHLEKMVDRLTSEPSYVNGFEDGKKHGTTFSPVWLATAREVIVDGVVVKSADGKSDPVPAEKAREPRVVNVSDTVDRDIASAAARRLVAAIESTSWGNIPTYSFEDLRTVLARLEAAEKRIDERADENAALVAELETLRDEVEGEPAAEETSNFSTLLRKLVEWLKFDHVTFRTLHVDEVRTLVEGIKTMAGYKVAARAEKAEAHLQDALQQVATARDERDLARAERAAVLCDGCGSGWTDEDVRQARASQPSLVSCCPERKPLTIAQWRERAHKVEAERDELAQWKRDGGDTIVTLTRERDKAFGTIEGKEGIILALENEKSELIRQRDQARGEHDFWQKCAEERGRRVIALEDRISKARAYLIEEQRS